MTDFFVGPSPAPQGEATLDELEDLVEISLSTTGGLRSLPPDVLARYRTVNGDRQRYALLFDIWQSLSQRQRELGLGEYNTQFGLLGTLVEPGSDLNGRGSDDPIFTSGVSRFRIADNPLVEQPDSNFDGTTRPFQGRATEPVLDPTQLPATEQEEIAVSNLFQQGDLRFLPEGERPLTNDVLNDIAEAERQRAVADLERQRQQALANINQAVGAAQAQFDLAEQSSQFAQSVNNFNGPLSNTRGNINSGFQRARRGIANTGFGFERRGRRLQLQQTLDNAAQQRQQVNDSFRAQSEQLAILAQVQDFVAGAGSGALSQFEATADAIENNIDNN